MKITFMTLQKASIVCLGVGMFLALGSAGTFETTGEIQTGVYVAAFVFLLAAGLLMRLSFALQDYEEKQRKIHKAQRGTVKDDADPDKVAQEFGALLSRNIARTIRENREKAKGGERQ